VKYGDGSQDSLHQTSAVWERTPAQVTVALKSRKKVSSVTVKNGIWVDADTTNNSWKSK